MDTVPQSDAKGNTDVLKWPFFFFLKLANIPQASLRVGMAEIRRLSKSLACKEVLGHGREPLQSQD